MMERESKIARELQRLAAIHGDLLQPHTVVDEARDPESPLHDSFDWDDTDAAQKWRLQQARQLLRVLVKYEPLGDGKMVPCRVFVSLTSDRKGEGGGYRLATAVLSDADQRRQMLADARAEMIRFKEKYRSLNELADVFDAIDRAAETPALAQTA